jgi:hypothetical protein
MKPVPHPEKTVHLVYPHGPRICCPDAIGRNLAGYLARYYRVLCYDWNSPESILPGENDVLLGHPHPSPWTCFRRSMKHSGWKRILLMSPFHHGDAIQVAFLNSSVKRCDAYLAITGNYWIETLKDSFYSAWTPKIRHLDLAVDPADYPFLKKEFALPGNRRFLYIGHSGWTKNISYLEEIISALPEIHFSWIGSGKHIRGTRAYGPQDFSTPGAQDILRAHDFTITVGKADANPTTILESMAWGLIPLCTPQSGYVRHPGILNIPLNDLPSVVSCLKKLQYGDEAHLKKMQADNLQALKAHFNWNRFGQQVRESIESPNVPSTIRKDLLRDCRIWYASARSPYSAWRPRNAAKYAFQVMRGRSPKINPTP